ncbi:MAG: acyl carrier protein [Bauldia sp.]
MPEPDAAMPVAAAVLAAIAETAGRDAGDILPEHDLARDLGIDSLEFVRLVQIVEDNAGVILSDEHLAAVVTVADLVALVQTATTTT